MSAADLLSDTLKDMVRSNALVTDDACRAMRQAALELERLQVENAQLRALVAAYRAERRQP